LTARNQHLTTAPDQFCLVPCCSSASSTNTWSATGRVNQASNHSLTLLFNGQVLVGGGDAELYTP
jgi:hypothetical protein